MIKPEHTRPFNAEHARAGAPFCTRSGNCATVLKWDCKKEHFPLVGVIGEFDTLNSWTKEGKDHYGRPGENCDDLVMTQLGMLDGKPVFAGDVLVDDEQYGYGTFTVGPTMRQGYFGHCKWPEPEPEPAPTPVYPETRMEHIDLAKAAFNVGNGAMAATGAQLKSIANAALRHAIESGQVVVPTEAAININGVGTVFGDRKAIEYINEFMFGPAQRQAERDMAIAEAVRDATYVAIMKAMHGREKYVVEKMDLAAIIAKVQK